MTGGASPVTEPQAALEPLDWQRRSNRRCPQAGQAKWGDVPAPRNISDVTRSRLTPGPGSDPGDFVRVNAQRLEEFLVGVRLHLLELAVPVVLVLLGESGGGHDFHPAFLADHVLLLVTGPVCIVARRAARGSLGVAAAAPQPHGNLAGPADGGSGAAGSALIRSGHRGSGGDAGGWLRYCRAGWTDRGAGRSA